MATSCDLANSSRPAKRGTPGKRKKLVARLLNEADSKITLKQRSEKKRERGGVDDSQNDRGERRGGDKKQEKEKERTEGMKEARPLGRDVRKRFLGYGVFSGKVVSYNPDSGLYGIEYEDGEYEELDELKVQSVLVPHHENKDLRASMHVGKTIAVHRSKQVSKFSR